MLDRQGEGRVTFGTLKKISNMLKLNLTDDQVQEAIQSIAGKGKQALTWEQFNAHLAKKLEKKKWSACHNLPLFISSNKNTSEMCCVLRTDAFWGEFTVMNLGVAIGGQEMWLSIAKYNTTGKYSNIVTT